MFTPQEVREQSMDFEKAVFGGYNMKAVDDFMAPMVEDYSALYKENAVLKSKMKVLVDKLEEYHQREDAMNKAILTAQQTADEMVVEAERKCAKMLSDTEDSLRIRAQELKQEIAIEGERVTRAKKTASAFILHVEEQMRRAVEQLEQIKEMTITPKREKTPQPMGDGSLNAAQEISVNIQNIINDLPEDLEPMGSESMMWEDEEPQQEPVHQNLDDTIVIRPIEG